MHDPSPHEKTRVLVVLQERNTDSSSPVLPVSSLPACPSSASVGGGRSWPRGGSLSLPGAIPGTMWSLELVEIFFFGLISRNCESDFFLSHKQKLYE